MPLFWSSADLTGNQTGGFRFVRAVAFWSSADLTGNQTGAALLSRWEGFGAVAV